MADIFISYARSDRPRAALLAHVLESHGYSVWWGHDIPVSRSFGEATAEALSGARCVLVLWSPVSVRSEFVKAEATQAAQWGLLVPVIIERARLPFGFRRRPSAVLDRWDDPSANPDWVDLLQAIATLVRRPNPVARVTMAVPGPEGAALPRGRAVVLTVTALMGIAMLAAGF